VLSHGHVTLERVEGVERSWFSTHDPPRRIFLPTGSSDRLNPPNLLGVVADGPVARKLANASDVADRSLGPRGPILEQPARLGVRLQIRFQVSQVQIRLVLGQQLEADPAVPPKAAVAEGVQDAPHRGAALIDLPGPVGPWELADLLDGQAEDEDVLG